MLTFLLFAFIFNLGVWTLEKLGLKPENSVLFEDARPSLAHHALVELERHGKNYFINSFRLIGFIKFLITQNIDGLHLRSGYPRDCLAILHGDMFLDSCCNCGTLYVRNTPTKTIGLKRSLTSCTYLKTNKRICRLVFKA